MLREFLTRLRFFVSRKRPVDLDDELQFHLDQSTQANIAAGMTPEEARRQAGIVFGGVERTREQCYEQAARTATGRRLAGRWLRSALARTQPHLHACGNNNSVAWHWRDYSRLQCRGLSAFAPTSVPQLRANRQDLEYVLSPRDDRDSPVRTGVP
jgi:hypothetical protein